MTEFDDSYSVAKISKKWLLFDWEEKVYALDMKEWGPILPYRQNNGELTIFSYPFLPAPIAGVFLWNYDMVFLLDLNLFFGTKVEYCPWGILLGQVNKDEIYGIPLYKPPSLVGEKEKPLDIEILNREDILDSLF
ncbi:MAG: hypothetical protein D6785_01710 [Planctomycetota bacterium]|nr:MAG: hypothetical protein D6785_01710 [Planctomycetota bacterium]